MCTFEQNWLHLSCISVCCELDSYHGIIPMLACPFWPLFFKIKFWCKTSILWHNSIARWWSCRLNFMKSQDVSIKLVWWRNNLVHFTTTTPTKMMMSSCYVLYLIWNTTSLWVWTIISVRSWLFLFTLGWISHVQLKIVKYDWTLEIEWFHGKLHTSHGWNLQKLLNTRWNCSICALMYILLDWYICSHP